MKGIFFALTATLAVASPIAELEERSAHNKNGKDSCPQSSCAVRGKQIPHRSFAPYWKSKDRKYKSTGACAAHCLDDKKCDSFSVGDGFCKHYKTP